MAYSTATQVRAETPFKDTGKVSDTFINTQIAEADSIIIGKIADVYTVPLAVGGVAIAEGSEPPIINFLSKQIAKGLLFQSQFSEEIAGSTMDGSAIINEAMAILDSIQALKEKIRTTAGVEPDRQPLRRMTGYPTEGSTDDGTTPVQFSMTQQF